jgi:hypothetical protein
MGGKEKSSSRGVKEQRSKAEKQTRDCAEPQRVQQNLPFSPSLGLSL